MADCPNCGSDHIQITQETNVNWGRAVVNGWALFRVVGGAVGAVSGENRHSNICLDCGTSWKAKDLYNTLQEIREITGVNLKLSRREDRQFMNNFINDIDPFLELVNEQKKIGEKLLNEAEWKARKSTIIGCKSGIIVANGGCLAIIRSGSGSGWGILLMSIIPPVVLSVIGMLVDNSNKEKNEKYKKEIQEKIEIKNKKSKRQFKEELTIFLEYYTIEDNY